MGLEEAVAAESHRRLVTACTYVGGGSGTKCVGTNACTGLDESKVGCGSCIGTDACSGFYGSGTLTIGEKSCIGDNSCKNIYAKDSGSPVVIGDGSCLNNNEADACYNVYAAYEGGITVGNGSCHDNVGCKYLQGKSFVNRLVCVHSTPHQTNIALFFYESYVQFEQEVLAPTAVSEETLKGMMAIKDTFVTTLSIL